MSQAKSDNTTRARAVRALPASVNKTQRNLLPVPLDPNELPEIYGMMISGDCLLPEIEDGAVMKFSKSEPYKPGDFVLVYRRPELVKPGALPGMLKRLVVAPPPWVTFPYRENPKSELRALLIAEQLNPRAQFAIPCADLVAVHKCLGRCEPDEMAR